ncbi:hypothetical protein RKK42_26030 [Klebsiella pneumoniae]|nr:hypothetical protein [Klebsiella pneumoniae]
MGFFIGVAPENDDQFSPRTTFQKIKYPSIKCFPVISIDCSGMKNTGDPTMKKILVSFIAMMGSPQKTESMVTPVFATPILTTSWLA